MRQSHFPCLRIAGDLGKGCLLKRRRGKPVTEKRMKLVLVTPEIPGNTGTIGRTCVALDLELILIRPYGFSIDDKAVRRAGLDYWKHVMLSEYE